MFSKITIGIVIAIACITLARLVIASDNNALKPAGPSHTTVSLAGEWRMCPGDNYEYAAPEFNDSAWDTVSLPGNLMPDVFRKGAGDRGILWLRKTVTVDPALAGDDIGLILGRIAHADETYFNGKKIGGMGSFPPAEFSMWNHPRYYTVPRSIIRPGMPNVIAVRLYYHVYGDMVGSLGMAPPNAWEQHRVISYFFFIIIPYLIIAMGATILIIFALFMFRKENFQEYAFYCMQLVCAFLIILDGCNFWNIYGSMYHRYILLCLAWVGVIVLHHRFLHRIYNFRRPMVERVFYLYSLAALACLLVFSNQGNIRFVGVLFVGCSLPVAVYNFSLNLQMFLRKNTCFRFFSVFEFIALFGGLHDGAIYMLRFMGLPLKGAFLQYMIFPYAMGTLFVGIVLVLAVGFIRIAGEKKSLSLSLDTFARENAILTRRLSESRPGRRGEAAAQANGRTDERIEQVISYIRDNYRENLSREGLAAMVDLHPDSLSRFFKQYTRKRIGDYINELRVDDAARSLVQNSDVAIIRIAFDVGFDSLRTFNRAFRKTKGQAPEQYRRAFRDPTPFPFSPGRGGGLNLDRVHTNAIHASRQARDKLQRESISPQNNLHPRLSGSGRHPAHGSNPARVGQCYEGRGDNRGRPSPHTPLPRAASDAGGGFPADSPIRLRRNRLTARQGLSKQIGPNLYRAC